MTGELWYEEPCEHGFTGEHGDLDLSLRKCPGGSRRRINLDYEAAMDRFWMETNWDEQPEGYDGAGSFADLIHRVVDAAVFGDDDA